MAARSAYRVESACACACRVLCGANCVAYCGTRCVAYCGARCVAYCGLNYVANCGSYCIAYCGANYSAYCGVPVRWRAECEGPRGARQSRLPERQEFPMPVTAKFWCSANTPTTFRVHFAPRYYPWETISRFYMTKPFLKVEAIDFITIITTVTRIL